ncbi:hypothetical protein EVAR_60883_1 [Eumeta japonica]|uniref:Uncharacterized protein n=1 Tax=Eumeta variegata TaxID=151549 RepID=A0A4C1YFN0_EUMVA|nr:hypothetical protein EVAR_60883_1 [Eumeta japonica]
MCRRPTDPLWSRKTIDNDALKITLRHRSSLQPLRKSRNNTSNNTYDNPIRRPICFCDRRAQQHSREVASRVRAKGKLATCLGEHERSSDSNGDIVLVIIVSKNPRLAVGQLEVHLRSIDLK